MLAILFPKYILVTSKKVCTNKTEFLFDSENSIAYPNQVEDSYFIKLL